MSAAILKAGASGPQRTKISKSISDKDQTVVTIEGLYTALDAADPADYVPSGLVLESSQLSSSGDGMGVLTLNCRAYDDPSATNLSPIRTTVEVDMEEVQYDLEDHPRFSKDERSIICKWLATDESVRCHKDKEGEDKYYYKDLVKDESSAPPEEDEEDDNGDSGEDDDSSEEDTEGKLVEAVVEVTQEAVIDFCNAYMAGIKTFNRYYPVVIRHSIWKNPPGLTRVGRSFTEGSLPFSAMAGKFDTPPISLNGYPDENWFHGQESWVQNENKTWTRTETWTYTPDGSNGPHAWIYEEPEESQENSEQGGNN